MKVYVTVERVLSRGYTVEVKDPSEVEEAAEALMEHLMEHPEEMEDSCENWDYAVSDEEGRDLIPWSR